MKSVQRVILILKLLEMGQRLNKYEIAKRFRTSVRTVYRDLSLLKRMNIPIRQVGGEYSLNKSAWAKWTNRNVGVAIRKSRK